MNEMNECLLRHCSVLGFNCLFLCLLHHSASPQGFHWFINRLLRHCSVLCFDCLFLCFLRHYRPAISSRFSLFHYLFVTSLLCSRLQLSLPLFLTSLYYLFEVSIVSLSVCYVTALFEASIVFSCLLHHYTLYLKFSLFHYLFYVTISSMFQLFIICLLRHCSVLGFDCLFFLCVLRRNAFSSWFPLFHYLFVKSLLYSRLRLSLPLFVTSLYYLFKVSLF